MAISIGFAAWSLVQVVHAAAPTQQSRWTIVASDDLGNAYTWKNAARNSIGIPAGTDPL